MFNFTSAVNIRQFLEVSSFKGVKCTKQIKEVMKGRSDEDAKQSFAKNLPFNQPAIFHFHTRSIRFTCSRCSLLNMRLNSMSWPLERFSYGCGFELSVQFFRTCSLSSPVIQHFPDSHHFVGFRYRLPPHPV